MDEKKLLSGLALFALTILMVIVIITKEKPETPAGQLTNWTWKNEWSNNAVPRFTPTPKEEVVQQTHQGYQVATFDEALRASNKEKLPICILFSTQWCGYCTKLKQEIKKPEVQQALKKYIYVPIDAGQDRTTAAQFGVNSVPYLVISDPTGKDIDRLKGYNTADNIIGFLNKSSHFDRLVFNKEEVKPQQEVPELPSPPEKEEEPKKIFRRNRD